MWRSVRSTSLEQGREGTPDPCPAPVQQHSLIGLRDPEDVTGLSSRHALEIPQDDHGPLAGGKRLDGGIERMPDLLIQGQCLRITRDPGGGRLAPALTVVEPRPIGRVRDVARVRLQIGERHEPPFAHRMRPRPVREDVEHPRAERGTLLEVAKAPEDREPRLLDDIVRESVGPNVGARKPPQAVLVTVDQALEGGLVARQQAIEQFCIGVSHRGRSVASDVGAGLLGLKHTGPYKEHTVAFITVIPPDQADGELADVYRRIAHARGGVAAVHQVQSLNPKVMSAHLEHYKSIMFQSSPLTRAQREAIAVAVSRANGCAYCVAHHSEALARLAAPPVDPRLLEWAERLARHPGQVGKADVDMLRQLGLDDRAILDAVLTVAYFCFVNRLVVATGVELESDFETTCRPDLGE